MNLTAIVAQLETVPELYGKVVVGMPAQMESIGNAPYAWVTAIVEEGGSSPVIGPVRQRIGCRLDVMVGTRTLEDMSLVRESITNALLNFQPDKSYEPMTFSAGNMEFGDPGWFYWRDEYHTAYWRDCNTQQFIGN